MCNPAGFADGYGNFMDRNNGCYGEHSVIVTVTDTW